MARHEPKKVDDCRISKGSGLGGWGSQCSESALKFILTTVYTLTSLFTTWYGEKYMTPLRHSLLHIYVQLHTILDHLNLYHTGW